MPSEPAAPAIRALTPADAAACDQIVLSLPYHFGDESGRWLCAQVVRTSDGLVAALEDRVVGFLTLERHFWTSAEITWMAIHADHRRRGIGRALIERLCAMLIAEGRRLLTVMTLSASVDEGAVEDSYRGTRAFYERMGFIPTRDLPNYWPNTTALLLVRPLVARDGPGNSSPG